MLANIIILGVIVICLAVIIFIVIKKFPNLSQVDVETLPKVKEENTKKRIIRERLEREVLSRIRSSAKKLKPASDRMVLGFRNALNKTLEMERSYRKKLEQPRTHEEKQKIEAKTDDLVEEGEKLLSQNNFAEAERKFIDAIALDPKGLDAYKGLGELYFEQGKMTEAKETFEYILKLNADNYDAYSHLGNIALAQGNPEAARVMLLKSIELDSQAAVHYLDLAKTYRELDQSEEAYNALQKAVGLEPNNPRNLDALLDLSIILGKKKEAKDLLAKLTEVNPENQKIEEFKERIKQI